MRAQAAAGDRARRARASSRRLPDVDREPAGVGPVSVPAVAEPRQRWRITFARPSRALQTPHREIAERWLADLEALELPLARGPGRAKSALSFAAPLPVGVVAEHEVADLVLAERLAAWQVRDAIAAAIPHELDLVDIHDVWLGSRPLPALVRAADYRSALDGSAPADELERIEEAIGRLLRASTIDRERPRGTGRVRYDLRPLVERVVLDRRVAPALLMRTRFLADRGTGRPEEVIAALEAIVGRPIPVVQTKRERIVLDES